MAKTGIAGKPPLMSVQLVPALVVRQTLPALKVELPNPPFVTKTLFESVASIAIRVTWRPGNVPEPTCVHTVPPFVVMSTRPLSYPTQIVFESPGFTAIALISPPVTAGLIELQQGVVAFTFALSQS
jgi:hypothetical protein